MTVAQNPDLYRILPGEGYAGVVQVLAGSFYGSGMVLHGGRAVLTAAHVIDDATSLAVQLDTPDGPVILQATRYSIHPDYDPVTSNNDLALLWLADPAPLIATRSGLYRDGDELGQKTTLVGYGLTGDGLNGSRSHEGGVSGKHFANNQFDTTGDALKTALGYNMGWSSTKNSQLIIDFDDGGNSQDALGVLMGIQNTGVGSSEGLIASGDSGGPAFIDDKVAGVATYIARLSNDGSSPDVNNEVDSSFGEIAAFQRVDRKSVV